MEGELNSNQVNGFNRSQSRRRFLINAAAAGVTCTLLGQSCAKTDRLLQLAWIGDRFTFAIVADPQVAVQDSPNPLPANSEKRFSQIIEELNQLSPKLPFVICNGDLVERPKPEQFDNFLHRVKALQTLPILVHGNHDGYFPYNDFKRMQQSCNKTEGTEFSFNCGRWHFLTFPCNFEDSDAYQAHLLQWLAADLKAHQHQPTIAFVHYHLLPQGLTQLLWYTYEKSLKQKLLDLLAQYGNVRYVICGHVHNGIQTSVKTAWTYKGINFITAPTCTGSRNFGEEFPEFEAGMPRDEKNTGGGYYLLVDIDGESAQVRGRLVGTPQEYRYAQQFKPYKDEEPLWLKHVTDYPPNPTLVNPSFDRGLEGWKQPYRYMSDINPGYVAIPVAQPTYPSAGGQSAFLSCHEKGQNWCRDELMEIYQLVQVPNRNWRFTAHYLPQLMRLGGGYLRLSAYSGKQLQLIALLDWSDGRKADSFSFVRNAFYVSLNQSLSYDALIQWGEQKKALFWELPAAPDRWHQVQVNLDAWYDRVLAQPGAFAALNIDQVLVSLGVWCLCEEGSQSAALFDLLSLEPGTASTAEALVINGESIAVDARSFQTTFGAEIRKRTPIKSLELKA